MRVAASILIPALSASLLLTGCVTALGSGSNGEKVQARLSPEVVGRPGKSVIASADNYARMQTVALSDDTQQVKLLQAARDPQFGTLIFCTETLLVQSDIVTGYQLEGNGC